MLPRGGVSIWFWCSWFWASAVWVNAIHPKKFTVTLTTLMECDRSRSALLGCDPKKMYQAFSKPFKSYSSDLELHSVHCVHEEPNGNLRLLQFNLDMSNVKKFGLDVDSDQAVLDFISPELDDPPCLFSSLDVQYPVEKEKYRIRIDGKIQQNCQQEKWNPYLLHPNSELFKSFEESAEKQVRSLLEELNYLRFVDDITVAYFYSKLNETSVVLLMDLDKKHLSQKFVTLNSISQSISNRLSKQQSCAGMSLVLENIEHQIGYWEKPYFKTTMTMVLRCNKEYSLKELRRTLSQKMINLGGTGHVGKVKLIYQDSQSKLTLFQMDFDVSDMFDLELDGPGIEVLADEISCNPSTSEHFLTRLNSQYPVEKHRYRISIDAEVQQNCQPVLWHSNLLNSSSDQFEQQREVVEKQIFSVLGQWNNLSFLNSSTVAYFYPRGDQLAVVVYLELERQDVDRNSIKLSSISESFSEHLFKQRQCKRNAHSLVNTKYEIGHWKGLEALLKAYTRITLIGSLQRNGANAIWNANYGQKWSMQYRDAVTVINHQMNRVLELKKIDAWRNQFTLDHFFRQKNRVKVVLYFYVPTSSLEDPTRNENLEQDLRSVLHNLKSRDGLQATDVDLQADPPKRTADDSAKEAESEYALNKKEIAFL